MSKAEQKHIAAPYVYHDSRSLAVSLLIALLFVQQQWCCDPADCINDH